MKDYFRIAYKFALKVSNKRDISINLDININKILHIHCYKDSRKKEYVLLVLKLTVYPMRKQFSPSKESVHLFTCTSLLHGYKMYRAKLSCLYNFPQVFSVNSVFPLPRFKIHYRQSCLICYYKVFFLQVFKCDFPYHRIKILFSCKYRILQIEFFNYFGFILFFN